VQQGSILKGLSTPLIAGIARRRKWSQIRTFEEVPRHRYEQQKGKSEPPEGLSA
jgi:hypothetical protein